MTEPTTSKSKRRYAREPKPVEGVHAGSLSATGPMPSKKLHKPGLAR